MQNMSHGYPSKTSHTNPKQKVNMTTTSLLLQHTDLALLFIAVPMEVSLVAKFVFFLAVIARSMLPDMGLLNRSFPVPM